MEIGRKVLSESEFSNLWGVLYQEFFNLSVTNSCDATLVYNTIYIICTSGSSLETKLYWKIGDFLLNRCKIHRDQIGEARDYIGEYILRFDEYQKLVESIHSLGAFLNDSVKEKKLNDFGYLLWERIVIQSLSDTFFIDVFQYQGDIMRILNSFERIIPDPAQKLLYYKEKYEKVVMQHIRSKYKSVEFTSLVEFCDIIKVIVGKESDYMRRYMLPESYDRVKHVLEECLLADKYYELVINLKNFCQLHNHELHGNGLLLNYADVHGRQQVYNSAKCVAEPGQDGRIDFAVALESGYKRMLEDIDGSAQAQGFIYNGQNILLASFSTEYVHLSQEGAEIARSCIDNILKGNKMLAPLQTVINKEHDDGAEVFAYKSYSPIFIDLMNSLGVLDTGFVLIKKAYALYIEVMLQLNLKMLESSVREIFRLLETLDIFHNADCQLILHSIFKQHLQRTKPCYMKRLCDFTESMVSESPDVPVSSMRPFDPNENMKIFRVSTELISDRSEFMNMYQTALKERVISGTSNLNKERAVLNCMEISPDDRLFKMLAEIESNRGSLKLLSGAYWAIEPENSAIVLPGALLDEVERSCPRLVVSSTRGRGQPQAQASESSEMRYRLEEQGQERSVHMAHQYSRVVVGIDRAAVMMNIYQYVAIDSLSRGPSTAESMSKMTGVPENVLKGALQTLVEYKIARCSQGVYEADSSGVQDCDITGVHGQEEKALDVCVESYVQALSVKVLKRAKRMEISKLVKVIKEQSRLEIGEEFVVETLSRLVDKGLIESKNSSVEYVF